MGHTVNGWNVCLRARSSWFAIFREGLLECNIQGPRQLHSAMAKDWRIWPARQAAGGGGPLGQMDLSLVRGRPHEVASYVLVTIRRLRHVRQLVHARRIVARVYKSRMEDE